MMVDAMVNDIFGFFNDVCKMKSIFVFSDLMMAENIKVVYGVGKVFLTIKNGPGFMVSQMHSLSLSCGGQWNNKQLTYEIATQGLITSYFRYMGITS